MEKQKPRIVISPNLKKESVIIDPKTGRILEKRINGKIVALSEEDKKEIKEE